MLSDLFFSLRECSISDLLRNPPIYRIKNLRKRKEILSPLYRIAIMRNIQIFNTFVIKSPVLRVSDQRVKITYFRATHCHIPCIREYTPPKPLSCNAGSNAGSNAVFANRISSKMDLHHNATPT